MATHQPQEATLLLQEVLATLLLQPVAIHPLPVEEATPLLPVILPALVALATHPLQEALASQVGV